MLREKIEYKLIHIDDWFPFGDKPTDIVQWLNELGDEGWELCTGDKQIHEDYMMFTRKVGIGI